MSNMKMSDVFCCEVDSSAFTVISGVVKEYADDSVMPHEYTAHAINNHDRMVEEIAELKVELKSMIGKGIDLLNVEDVTDEEDAFSIHSKFNDAIINSQMLLNKND